MNSWIRNIIHTSRGEFEVFIKGNGDPLCVTHHYSEFNNTGDYFAEAFTETNKVFLVNLREAGSSSRVEEPYQLSFLETIFDLEAIREKLKIKKWGFAGHSTGGMLGIIYGIYFSDYLNFTVIVGAAAREYMTFSEDCIYNSKHPNFDRMQELTESLKRQDLSLETKNNLKIERTKLSLFNPEQYAEYFSMNINKGISAIRMNYFSREVQVYDVTKKLVYITTPTLIICGKYDVQCPVIYSMEMAEYIPDSKLVVFNRSNHYPFLEEAELFKKEYNLFINQQIHSSTNARDC